MISWAYGPGVDLDSPSIYVHVQVHRAFRLGQGKRREGVLGGFPRGFCINYIPMELCIDITCNCTYLTPGDLVDTSSAVEVGQYKNPGLHMIRDKAASNCLPRFRPSPQPGLPMFGVSFWTSFNLTPWSGPRFGTCNTLFERYLSIVNLVVRLLHCYGSICPRSSI